MSILRKAVLATAGAIAAALVLPTINAEPPAVGSPEAKAGQGNGAEEKRAWGKPVEGQSLSIATEKSIYAINEDIVVSMRLKNVGRGVVVDPRQVRVTHKAWEYCFNVVRQSGETVPMTELGRAWFDPNTLPMPERRFGGRCVLKPGGFFGRDVMLDWYFEMGRPGRYIVQAKWKVVADGGRLSLLQVLSNKLEDSVLAELVRRLGFSWPHQEYRLSPTEAVSNRLEITVDPAAGVRARRPNWGRVL